METTFLGKNAKYAKYPIVAAIAVVLFFLFDSPLTVGVKAKLAYLLPISDSQRDGLIRTWCERAFVGSSSNAYSSCYFAYKDKRYARLKTICYLVKIDMEKNPKSWVNGGDNVFLYLGDNLVFKNASNDSVLNLSVCDGVE